MKENTFLINNKTQDIRMMTDFRDELERIKQKLAQDFSKYSEFEKMKNKQKVTGKAIIFRKNEDNNIRKTKTDDAFFEKGHSADEFDYKYGLQNNNNTFTKINTKISDSNSPVEKEKEKDDFINNINNNKYKSNLKNLSSINTHNINPLNYNISFRKKYIDISNEEEDDADDLNFSFTNDLNKKRNLTAANSQDATKIINNNINININNNSSLILDSKLDRQIKFIDEKSENNRIEEEKTQKKNKTNRK